MSESKIIPGRFLVKAKWGSVDEKDFDYLHPIPLDEPLSCWYWAEAGSMNNISNRYKVVDLCLYPYEDGSCKACGFNTKTLSIYLLEAPCGNCGCMKERKIPSQSRHGWRLE